MLARRWLVVGLLLGLTGASADRASGEDARLLADLNQRFDSVPGSRPRQMASLGEVVVFVADAPGGTIWRSDGTSAGTFPLVEGCPGASTAPLALETVGTVAFFSSVATCDEAGVALWRTDGTAVGTFPLPTPGRELPFFNIDLSTRAAAAYRGRLYFVAYALLEKRTELWRTDGTPAGTERVVEFPHASSPEGLAVAADRLLVLFADEIWRSDGTAAGTARADTISLCCSAGFVATTATHAFVEVYDQGLVLHDQELFGIGGVSGGLQRILPAEENYGSQSGHYSNGSEVAFLSTDGVRGPTARIWRSDGTAAGTHVVTGEAIAPRPAISAERWGEDAIAFVGSRIYFLADLSPDEVALFVTEDRPESARLVLSLGRRSGLARDRLWLVALGDRLLFPRLGEEGLELWVFEGAAEGGRPLVDACSGSCDGRPVHPFVLGDRLFWVATDEAGKPSLWTSDGTPSGTLRLLSDMQRIGSEIPYVRWSITPAGGRWLFPAADFFRGTELWAVGLAADSGRIVADLLFDTPGSHLESVVADGFRTFLGVASTSRNDWRLFQTDGLAPPRDMLGTAPYSEPPAVIALDRALVVAERSWGGSVRALDRETGHATELFDLPVPGRPNGLALVGSLGREWAVFREPFSGELWATDGTSEGSERVVGTPCADPCALLGSAGLRYLVLASGDELLSFDGETRQLSWLQSLGPDLLSCADSVDLCQTSLHDVRGRLYFELWSRERRRSVLWRSDGTAVGTHELTSAGEGSVLSATAVGSDLIYSIRPGNTRAVLKLLRDAEPAPRTLWISDEGTPSGVAERLIGLEQGVLFVGWDRTSGFEIWFADSARGSVLQLTDLADGPDSWSVGSTLAGRRGAFFISYESGARQLWHSDGTVEGTVRLGSLSEPLDWSSVVSDERLFYRHDDGVHGRELWTSDGTAEGTHLVADIWPGEESSEPGELAAAGAYLYFTAADGVHGREVWVTPISGGEPCRASESALCLGGGRFRVELHRVDPQGRQAAGQAIPLGEERGLFWFFTPELYEALVAVEPSREEPAHVGVALGSTSNVRFALTVADREAGATRRYWSSEGSFSSFLDPLAFGPLGSFTRGAIDLAIPVDDGAVSFTDQAAAASSGACAPTATRLCLLDGRYAAELGWRDAEGHLVPATVSRWTTESGLFSALAPDAPEWIVKLLDARPLTGHLWLFYGGVSDLPFELRLVELATGRARTYAHPAGELPAAADFELF